MRKILISIATLIVGMSFSQIQVSSNEVLQSGKIKEDIIAEIDVLNNSNSEIIVWERSNVSIPKQWETAACFVSCYFPEVSTEEVNIKIGSKEKFSTYFLPGETEGFGSVKMKFYPKNSPKDSVIVIFKGRTENSLSVENQVLAETVKIFPTVLNAGETIKTTASVTEYQVFSSNGQIINLEIINKNEILTASLSSGQYIVKHLNGSYQKIVIQ